MAKKSTTKAAVQKKQAKEKRTATASAAAAEKPTPKIFNNDDLEAKALFLQHLPKVKDLRAKVAKATADLRNCYKTAKAQGGFEKADFDYAIEVETAEAEAKARAKIARRLTIARYMGSDLGAQLEMFLEPDRTPAADRAYHEGQTASMKGETARPDYAPETEQYRQYMAGFHDDQAKRVQKGIKKTDAQKEVEEDTAKVAAEKQKNDDQRKADAAEFEKPTIGTPMTRAEFLAQQEAQAAGKEKPVSHFSKAN